MLALALELETYSYVNHTKEIKSHKSSLVSEPMVDEMFEGVYIPAWESVGRDYLEERGVSQEACQVLGLLFDEKENRILFPVRNRKGELFGFSGRLITEGTEKTKVKNYFNFKKSDLLLGCHLHTPHRPVFLMEGLFGVARWITNNGLDRGTPMAVMGSSLSNEQVRLLIDLESPVYILFDLDESGSSGTAQARKKLKGYIPAVYVPLWPEHLSDIDQWVSSDVDFMLSNAYSYL